MAQLITPLFSPDRCDLLAVDCEGVRLSRSGALTLVQIATASHVYLIDVMTLGTAGARARMNSPQDRPTKSSASVASSLRCRCFPAI